MPASVVKLGSANLRALDILDLDEGSKRLWRAKEIETKGEGFYYRGRRA
jgi:hypothetical protein